MNNPVLKIKSTGPINEANIDVGKVNVIGGVNGSGKTTVAKLLYCFLKVLSTKKEQYLHKEFVKEVNYFNKIFNYSQIVKVNQDFENGDSYEDVLKEFKKAKRLFFEHELDKTHFYPDVPYEKGYEIVFGKIELLMSLIEGKNKDPNFEILMLLMDDENVLNLLRSNIIFKKDSFEFISDDLDNCHLNYRANIPDVFYIDTNSILDLKNDHILFKEHIRHLKDSLNENPEWWDEMGGNLPIGTLYQLSEQPEILENNPIGIPQNLGEILNKASKNIPDEDKEILSKIENIVGGEYFDYDVDFGFKKQISKDVSYTNTTPSGIKQIGIIQILLSKGKLKKGSYLIMDEPEVNLHPEWQFKFAEILVLLAKELDITLYLNSHSPMFIEAIEVFSQYYDLEKDTQFYMTEKHDEKTYNFIKINYENIYDLYENLSKPYNVIEVYRLRAENKKKISKEQLS